MQSECVNWHQWQQFFAQRSERLLPELDVSEDYSKLPKSLARSLAIFQLGESGGGTVIEQARRSKLPGVNGRYADAMELFVAEEHRHANILAICVRMLDGTLIRSNWTARLFVRARRLMGLRLKVLVLLAAEVVGICYYHLLAIRLPVCRIRSMLLQIVDDEHSHLYFHGAFLRSQTRSTWRRILFAVVWRTTMLAAAIAVIIDHRAAIRDIGLDRAAVWQRLMSCSQLAERLVTGPSAPDGYLIMDPPLCV